MKPIRIGTSPLTNKIFAGHLMKDGRTWGAGKQDVTDEAVGAVCEHVMRNREPVTVTCNGIPAFRVIVERIDAQKGGA